MRNRDFCLDDARWRAWYRDQGRDDLSLLLFVVWDPIGVNDTAITANEYFNYTADVLRYVQDDDAPALTNYLLDIERSAMGLSHSTATPAIASQIIAGANASAWRWSGQPLPGD